MSGGSATTLWARAFMDELARTGVRDLCVAPGSRSTPLVLAAAQDPRFRMYPIVDERSAGFFALGLGKSRGRPAAVITTSGTAGANLFPSVIEASQGDVPLLVLTADRPHRLRDADGNQAMDQIRLFGTFPRAFFEVELPRLHGSALRHLRSLPARAVSAAMGPPPGPVHLNFPFEKPLEPPDVAGTPSEAGALEELQQEDPLAAVGRPRGDPFVRTLPATRRASEEELHRLASILRSARRGVIVAGPVAQPERVGPAALRLGAATGFPVLADPLSGARYSPSNGAHVVAGYDLFLRSEEAREVLSPDLVLRVGGSPTSSGALAYLAESAQALQVVLDDGHRWKDHLASAHEYLRADPAALLLSLAAETYGDPPPAWRDAWSDAESRTLDLLAGSGMKGVVEGRVLAMVTRTLPPGSSLFVGSSMPIRDLDAFGLPEGKPLRVFGNRGVSGIDGLVSTAGGLALGSSWEEGSQGDSQGDSGDRPTVGVLGDLAFLHDMNGLLALRSFRPSLTLVVVNNDGGGIFQTLPGRDFEPAFTRYFTTPHGLDFQTSAELYGIPFARAGSVQELKELLIRSMESSGPVILEIRTEAEEVHRRRRDLVSAVVNAMKDLKPSLE